MPIMLAGLLLARGRRTVTSWLRAQGILYDFEDYYYLLADLGLKIEPLATMVLRLLLIHLPIGERITLAIADTPTSDMGRERKERACITTQLRVPTIANFSTATTG